MMKLKAEFEFKVSPSQTKVFPAGYEGEMTDEELAAATVAGVIEDQKDAGNKARGTIKVEG